MKKYLALLLSFFCALAGAQTFPVQNLQVNGTSSFGGTMSGAGLTSHDAGVNHVQTVLNVAALRTTNCVAGLLYRTQGNATIADGGDGVYVCNGADTTSADNGGNIIAAANGIRYYLQRTTNGHLNVRTFGAKGDGSTNDQPSIQAALTWAGVNNTGVQGTTVVDVPPGQYLINSPGISIPQWVMLHGLDWLPDPSNTAQSLMTSFYINFGSGNAPGSGTPAVTMAYSSALEGITFFYPGQAAKTATSAIAFDWTITTPNAVVADSVHIRNVTLYNSYAGININGGGRIRIEDVQGDPLFAGISMQNNLDVSYVKNIHFWSFWTQGAALETWVAANLTAYNFQRVDGLQADSLFTYNSFTAFNFGNNSGTGLWANMTNIIADKSAHPMVFDGVAQVNIANFQLIGSVFPAMWVKSGSGQINLTGGQIANTAPVGVEVASGVTSSIRFSNVTFGNLHSAIVDESGTADIKVNSSTWAVPPFGQNNVSIDGQPLGNPTTAATLPTIVATGAATGSGLNWSFPLTSTGTSSIYFPFQDLNQKESIWTLEFNYNMPTLQTGFFFQVLVQTDVGTLTQVAYVPVNPLILNSAIGSGTPLIRIPIHAGYTQFVTRVIIQLVNNVAAPGSTINLTNIALYEQSNVFTTDAQVGMYLQRKLYLDAYGMGQVLFSKGKNRHVLTQPQVGYKNPEIPTSGTWVQGDEVDVFNPTATGCLKYINTAAGTPGTWTCLQIP